MQPHAYTRPKETHNTHICNHTPTHDYTRLHTLTHMPTQFLVC